MRQSKAMGLSVIDGASPATREERSAPAGAICPLCGRLFRRAGRLCKPCASRCEKRALAEQERDYLAAWLSTRDDDHSLLAERLRAKARARGMDWLLHDAPAPRLFKDRLEQVITAAILGVTTQATGTAQNAPVRGNAGRGGAVKGWGGTSGHHQASWRRWTACFGRPGVMR
jgi:hypothetical protein